MKSIKPFLFILILISLIGCTNTTRILDRSLMKGAGKNIWKSSYARYFHDSIVHRFGLDTLERFILIEWEDNAYTVWLWTGTDTVLFWSEGWGEDRKFDVDTLSETNSFIIKYMQLGRYDIIEKVSVLSGTKSMHGYLFVTDFDRKRKPKAITIGCRDFDITFDSISGYGSYPRELKQYIQDLEDNKNPEPPVWRLPTGPEWLFQKPQKTPEEE